MTNQKILILEPEKKFNLLDLKELWAYRELLYFLVWRDVKARYKQTVLGVFWIVIQPVVNVMVFSVLFGWLLSVP